jgi:hypothetical protein
MFWNGRDTGQARPIPAWPFLMEKSVSFPDSESQPVEMSVRPNIIICYINYCQPKNDFMIN